MPAIAGGGVIMDNAPHAFDLWRCFLGDAAAVFAAAGPSRPGVGVEDDATILLRDAGDRVGTIRLSWSHDLRRPDYLAIHGSEGSLGLGWRESWLQRRGGAARPFGAGYDKAASFRGVLAAFAAAIAVREAASPAPADLIANQRMIAAAYRSLRHGAWAAPSALSEEHP